MIHGFRDNKSLNSPPPPSTESIITSSAASKSPLDLQDHFPKPSESQPFPRGDNPDSRSGGLNYDLFLFGFTTTTRLYSNPRADSPGSRCPTIHTICQPNTQCCIWHVHGGFPPGGGRGCRDGEAQPAFNLTSATEGVSGLVVFGIISIHKLKPPRVKGLNIFWQKVCLFPSRRI